MTMPENLNPDRCPKCGNEKRFQFIPGRHGERVQCNECGKRGPNRVTRANAVKAWNEGRIK